MKGMPGSEISTKKPLRDDFRPSSEGFIETLRKIKIYLLDVPRPIIYVNLMAKFFTGLLIASLYTEKIVYSDLLMSSVSAFLAIHFIWGFNAMIDKERDKKSEIKSGRPLPSGKVNEEYLKIVLAITALISVLLSYFVNYYFLLLISISLLLGWFYSIKGRKHYIGGGSIFFIGSGVISFLLGYLVLTKAMNPGFLVFLFINGVFYGTHVHIKDIVDKDTDRISKDRSLPLIYGKGKTQLLALFGEIIYIGAALGAWMITRETYLLLININIVNFALIHLFLKNEKHISAYRGVFNGVTYTTFLVVAILTFIW